MPNLISNDEVMSAYRHSIETQIDLRQHRPHQSLDSSRGKWWSHQILILIMRPHYPKIKLHILEWPYCEFTQHLDMPHLSGRWIILAKGEVLANTDLNKFVNKI